MKYFSAISLSFLVTLFTTAEINPLHGKWHYEGVFCPDGKESVFVKQLSASINLSTGLEFKNDTDLIAKGNINDRGQSVGIVFVQKYKYNKHKQELSIDTVDVTSNSKETEMINFIKTQAINNPRVFEVDIVQKETQSYLKMYFDPAEVVHICPNQDKGPEEAYRLFLKD